MHAQDAGRSRQQFERWLNEFAERSASPRFVAALRAVRLEEQAGDGYLKRWGLGQFPGTPVPTAAPSTWVDKISQIGQAYLGYKTQQDVLDVQLKRLQQGLPPLDASQLSPTIRLGLDPATAREAAAAAAQQIGAGFRNLTPFLLIGGALVLFMVMRR